MKSYNNSISYRSEIDGLRALAVVPVILFHAGFKIFKGGFLGVDIFFIISGYLITTILITEVQQGKFSLINFYERRARRILPALFFLILICFIFSIFFLLPNDMQSFSKSIIFVNTFSSNFLFWQESGYFDVESELKPLLHTWSLAVEEQFYILFPIFLILFWRFGVKVVISIIITSFFLSLFLAHWGSYHKSVASFYLLPTRGWELLLGAFCSFILNFIKIPNHKIYNLISFIGFLAILISIVVFDESTPTPSFYTLLPTVGAVLIILFANKGTLVGSILGHKFLVGIGLISYSTYLWHQPLFSFFKLVIPQNEFIFINHQFIMIGLSFASLILGWFSWKFVEKPFRIRSSHTSVSSKSFLFFCLFLLLFSTSIAYYIFYTGGLPQRLNKDITNIINFENDRNPFKDTCQIENGVLNHPLTECSNYLINNKANVVFIGDSHSNAISYQAQEELYTKGISSYSVSYNACIGLPGFYTVTKPSSHNCNQYNVDILKFAKKVNASTLVITSRFPLYYFGTRFQNSKGGNEFGDPLFIDTLNSPNGLETYISEQLRRERVVNKMRSGILSLLNEFNVVLVYPIPEMGWNIPMEMAKCKLMKLRKCDLNYPIEEYLKRSQPISSMFDSIKSKNLFRVYPHKDICDEKTRLCNGKNENGRPLYFDDDHLSNNVGSLLLVPNLSSMVIKSLN